MKNIYEFNVEEIVNKIQPDNQPYNSLPLKEKFIKAKKLVVDQLVYLAGFLHEGKEWDTESGHDHDDLSKIGEIKLYSLSRIMYTEMGKVVISMQFSEPKDKKIIDETVYVTNKDKNGNPIPKLAELIKNFKKEIEKGKLTEKSRMLAGGHYSRYLMLKTRDRENFWK